MKTAKHHRRKIRHNIRPGILLLVIPLLIGAITLGFLFSNAYSQYLANAGATRLAAANWRTAYDKLASEQPVYERKFAYYKVQDGQTPEDVAAFFGMDVAKLVSMNPGTIVAGTTVKITPIEQPLQPLAGPNGVIGTARVAEEEGLLRVRQLYKLPQVQTTIPELMAFLRPYNAIEQVGPKTYRINRPISLDENIRLDVTSTTVDRLELRSAPNDITCLCFDGSSGLIKDVDVVSIDPATGKPDTNHEDQRSFIRAKSARVDIIDSRLSYLGNGLMEAASPTEKKPKLQREGGTYGISWRIPDDRLGERITTGWVEGNLFYKNHFGSYTFGASGMTWRNNHYLQNDVYGLDPHDDSNNALVEDNLFERNGKHGFIVSKRCNYNIIRNNTSVGNALHGFMLHQDSAYNVIEHNVAYGNGDNFAIFASDFNTLRHNKSYNARFSHIRINEKSRNTYVTDNRLYGSGRGVYVYGESDNVLIKGNVMKDLKKTLATDGASHVLFAQNTLSHLRLDIPDKDEVVFGDNVIDRRPALPPLQAPMPQAFTVKDLGDLN